MESEIRFGGRGAHGLGKTNKQKKSQISSQMYAMLSGQGHIQNQIRLFCFFAFLDQQWV